MTYQRDFDDGDPMLVRPFLGAGDQSWPDDSWSRSQQVWPHPEETWTGPTQAWAQNSWAHHPEYPEPVEQWPDPEPWPMDDSRIIRSHRGPDFETRHYEDEEPARRKGSVLLSTAGVIVAIGVVMGGYGLLGPQPGNQAPDTALPTIIADPSLPPVPDGGLLNQDDDPDRTEATRGAKPASKSPSPKASKKKSSQTREPDGDGTAGEPRKDTPAGDTETPPTYSGPDNSGEDPPMMRAPAVQRSGPLAATENRCLVAAGTLQVARCDGSVTQFFTLLADGTLQADGRCAQADGASVRFVACTEPGVTRWQVRGKAILAGGSCLTEPAMNDTTVRISGCDGSNRQQWEWLG